MSDTIITCPQCNTTIPLTEALSSKIKQELKTEFSAEQIKKQQELTLKLEQLEHEKRALKEKETHMQNALQEQLQLEKGKLWQVAQQKAQEKLSAELEDLKNIAKEREQKLEEAQKNELEMRRKTRELEEQKRQLDLEIQRKVDEARNSVAEKIKLEVTEENRLKIAEKDKQMEILKKTIEDLKRQSEQGSMQIQGEVQEADLKNLLRTTFISDVIEDVPAGVRGADLVHTVRSQFGQQLGVVLWESKNTKAWSGDWIKKMRSDQGLVNADVCILVSRALPEDISSFGLRDGVWITDYQFALPLVHAIRAHLGELHQAKTALVGREEKMNYLYQYLSSNQFRNRIENIVLAFRSMKEDLETEKRSMQRIWSKRDKEIERVMLNASGFYGDLQGIMGASLPAIQSLELAPAEEIV